MGEMKDAHVVEIPVDQEHQQKALIRAIQDHPLTEISHSPGHLLLLKLWQRDEDLFSCRIASLETRLDTTKQDIFHLSSFFLFFHGIFSILLFTSSINNTANTCNKWWVPSLVSLSTSLVFVFLVQVKVCRYWKVWRQLNKERSDARAVRRCIQELRMKGASFDLSKGPQTGKRLKSSSVEVKWKPVTWFSQNLITICLICITGLAFPASKLLLCGL